MNTAVTTPSTKLVDYFAGPEKAERLADFVHTRLGIEADVKKSSQLGYTVMSKIALSPAQVFAIRMAGQRLEQLREAELQVERIKVSLDNDVLNFKRDFAGAGPF